jgi:FAD-binding domain
MCAQIYVALPLVLYVAERVWRLVRNIAFRGELLDVELLPGSGKPPKPSGSVTVLRMRKPRDFSYRFLRIDAARNVLQLSCFLPLPMTPAHCRVPTKQLMHPEGIVLEQPSVAGCRPGMYVFINVPAISVMEWHPFSALHHFALSTTLLTLLHLSNILHHSNRFD